MDSSVFLILMIGIMVVFLILPQTLRSRKEKKFKNNLKKGDLIITKGGIHGKIIEVNNTNDTCVIETMAGKVKIERTSISYDMTLARNPKK
ncbi:MAG: preprotein translocase subunit YajC [Bacteroidota bacterium]|jgi:preprotein translocase subunit YajC|nr:preprotein translocase subunit YajC [Bacteroidota bacterium]MEC7286590.1 preprotein translocase subunit YajC [Bacteroidota bacterium]|tara:strand:+ start:3677 stop:3949 length:273 start_codon:yes stop_codon:yes gene_type:complete